LGWFERVYTEANGNAQTIPWADLSPNPNLTSWLAKQSPPLDRGAALVVGCGLGDDAEYLAEHGFRVTAFDIAPTAIEWCRRRFPQSAVDYDIHDLFESPAAWREAFDLVVEAYTLQVLPAVLRQTAMQQMATWVSPTGLMLVICRGRDDSEPDSAEMPWRLSRQEFSSLERAGLSCVAFEDYHDNEDPPVRRFRAVYRQLRNPSISRSISARRV
jgi:SAM-dependent methyltransferase